ncbi:MAG TPA: DNA oxidative demethylase AlkB [Burkholderiales bacterium]|nr:DNA oxidative demethylase AlkB [Burkholderiales bacterium]
MSSAAVCDLFDAAPRSDGKVERLGEDAVVLRGYAASAQATLLESLQSVLQAAPWRHMITPGGYRMSVAMTNCGRVGWVSDQRGYRYDPIDPTTGAQWPPIPACVSDVTKAAAADAGFAGFEPDVCLVNRYEPGARLTLHQDRNERDFTHPIVSISLGLPAVFLFGGLRRKDRPRRLRLESGDVVVWGGASRLAYHGVAPLADGKHPLTGRQRINLTLRRAS